MEESQWIIAMGTLLLAVIAAFQRIIDGWIKRPKLLIEASACPPYCHKNLLTICDPRTGSVVDTVDGYYLRLAVLNKGNARAEQVEVFADKLEKKQADGSFRECAQFDPMNLRWSHWELPVIDGITQDMKKYCGLAHIWDPIKRKHFAAELRKQAPDDQALLNFCLQAPPNTGTHVFEPGVYRLHVRVAGANAMPRPSIVEINFNGKWYPDESKMLGEGVGIRMRKVTANHILHSIFKKRAL